MCKKTFEDGFWENASRFGNFFSQNELQKIHDIHGLQHPLYSILNPYHTDSNGYSGFVKENTFSSFSTVKQYVQNTHHNLNGFVELLSKV